MGVKIAPSRGRQRSVTRVFLMFTIVCGLEHLGVSLVDATGAEGASKVGEVRPLTCIH